MLFRLVFVLGTILCQMLQSIPVPRRNWHPKTRLIKASYTSMENGNPIYTNLIMNTTRPTIRLDNYLSIVSITCTEKFMNIIFDNVNSTTLAYEAWSIDNLAFMLGQSNNCDGGTFSVESITIIGNSLAAKVEKLIRREMVQEWTAIVSTRDPGNLHKRFQRNRTFSLSTSVDDFFAKVGNPIFKTYDHRMVRCQNCFTNGSLNFDLELRGSFMNLTYYKIKVSGNFGASINLKLGYLPSDDIFIVKKKLVKIPLGAITIPGIISVGPKFQVELAWQLFSDAELSANLGFHIHFPINLELSSDTAKSTAKDTAGVKFGVYPLNLTALNPMPTFVGSNLNLNPEVAFEFSILNKQIAEAKSSFGNQIGLIYTPKSNASDGCGQRNSMDYFRRHRVQSSVSRMPTLKYIWTIWDTGRIPIFQCVKCNYCTRTRLQTPEALKIIKSLSRMFE